jgi:hypothetical protein
MEDKMSCDWCFQEPVEELAQVEEYSCAWLCEKCHSEYEEGDME